MGGIHESVRGILTRVRAAELDVDFGCHRVRQMRFEKCQTVARVRILVNDRRVHKAQLLTITLPPAMTDRLTRSDQARLICVVDRRARPFPPKAECNSSFSEAGAHTLNHSLRLDR
jgi:hypothetical protein